MTRKKQLYSFVEVIWDDAVANCEAWVHPSELGSPETVITRGWLVREDERALYVAGSIALEATEHDTVGGTMTIPKGMVRERREIRLRAASGRAKAKEG